MTKLFPACVLVLLATLLDCGAQDPKAWLNRVSTESPGPYKKLKPLAISYQLSWKKKVNAGKMTFILTEPNPGVYESKASGNSTGIPRALYPYNFSGTCQTNADTLKPLAFNFKDTTKSNHTDYTILFQANQMISETNVKNKKTGVVTPYRRVYKFEQDVALDLMSSVLYVRSQPLKDGDKLSVVTATFNKPYLTDFTVLGRERKTIKGKRYDTIKLDLTISKVHSNMTTEPYTKIEKATVWISDDDFRIPIEFQGDIFIGYISARLTSRRWL